MPDIKGIICINKPQNFTSFDVIAKMRGILGIKRLGHAGTLDPMATGVLPIFSGTATKACDLLPDSRKSYTADFALGFSTDTQDIWGKRSAESDAGFVTAGMIKNALSDFRGIILQTPPMYSAVSVNGQRLYDLARKGIEVDRQARKITVYELELASFDEKEKTGTFNISCSKGTYIRTLIYDIAVRLGTLGTMTSLIRTSSSGFSLNDCTTLEELQSVKDSGGNFFQYIIPIERIFSVYQKIILPESQAKLYKNGVKLDINRIKDFPVTSVDEKLCVYSGNEFLGLAVKTDEKLKIYKNFY